MSPHHDGETQSQLEQSACQEAKLLKLVTYGKLSFDADVHYVSSAVSTVLMRRERPEMV